MNEDRTYQRPDPLLTTAGEEEYEVEEIINHRQRRRGKHTMNEYLILWKGWPLTDAAWVRGDEVHPKENFRNMIDRDRPVQDSGEGSTA